jgi:hypothetical protein
MHARPPPSLVILDRQTFCESDFSKTITVKTTHHEKNHTAFLYRISRQRRRRSQQLLGKLFRFSEQSISGLIQTQGRSRTAKKREKHAKQKKEGFSLSRFLRHQRLTSREEKNSFSDFFIFFRSHILNHR